MNPEIIDPAEIARTRQRTLMDEEALVQSNRRERGDDWYYRYLVPQGSPINNYDRARSFEVALEGRLHASNELNGRGLNRGTTNFAFNIAQRMAQAFTRLDRRLVQSDRVAQDQFPNFHSNPLYSRNRATLVAGGLGIAGLLASGAIADLYTYPWYLQAATGISAAVGFEAGFHGLQRIWDTTRGNRRNFNQGQLNQLSLEQTERSLAEHSEHSARESTHQRIEGESLLETRLRERQQFLTQNTIQARLQAAGIAWMSQAEDIRRQIFFAATGTSSRVNHIRRTIQDQENTAMALRWLLGAGAGLALVAATNTEIMPNAPTSFTGEDPLYTDIFGPHQEGVSSHYGNLQAIVAREAVEDHLIDTNKLGFRVCRLDEQPPECYGPFDPNNAQHDKVVFDDYQSRKPVETAIKIAILDRKFRVHGGDNVRVRAENGELTDLVVHGEEYYLPSRRESFLQRAGRGVQGIIPSLDSLRHLLYQ